MAASNLPPWRSPEEFVNSPSPPPLSSPSTPAESSIPVLLTVQDIREYIENVTQAPLDEYKRGILSFMAFHARVVVAKNDHIYEFSSDTPVDELTLSEIERQWGQFLVAVEGLRPGPLFAEFRTLRAQIRELEDRLNEYEDVTPSRDHRFEHPSFDDFEDDDTFDEHNESDVEHHRDGASEEGDPLAHAGVADDFDDMREISENISADQTEWGSEPSVRDNWADVGLDEDVAPEVQDDWADRSEGGADAGITEDFPGFGQVDDEDRAPGVPGPDEDAISDRTGA
ncbi:hypothetical protein C7974DRAFT_408472 [Boeremia exigua]|uniref:uncharacterized protein n=1 Tax=Boeremia exigua TaxID=749465 RepID=UPI001E8EEA87|nr:uncharacterized protein C7974DRAFT_408472 [Boeremia exigua]KAH6644826.1 hypothetical protein C7974DRAFT_408472 [Boeremia exigua]